jgi:hypothetical protein
MATGRIMERIKTLHPEGKPGVSIDRDKYEFVRAEILAVLADTGKTGARFRNVKATDEPDLIDLVALRLGPDFKGSIGWYVTAIKLDLEARHELERVPKVTPQRVRLPR